MSEETTSDFAKLPRDQQLETVRRRILFQGGNEHEHFLLREVDALAAERDKALCERTREESYWRDEAIRNGQHMERLQARVERLEEALRYHGAHGPACMAGYDKPREDFTKPPEPRGPCDCGLSAALAEESP